MSSPTCVVRSSTSSSRPRRLKLLHFRLVLASIKKEHLEVCTNALLKLLLFPSSNDRFFSYNDTSDEVSLILDENAVLQFPPEILQHTNQIWRAFQVDEGPLGFESTGIVSSISHPLARARIPIYYLSTYQTDYTMVEEETLPAAIAALRAAGFTVNMGEGCSEYDGISVETGANTDAEVVEQQSRSTQTQMVITKLPYKLHLAQLPYDWVNHAHLIRAMLRAVFYPNMEKWVQAGRAIGDNNLEGGRGKSRFFSMTETATETSLILDEPSLACFDVELAPKPEVCPIVWHALQICEGAYGFNEAGIVSKFAQPVAEANISIFNLSTYFTDYILIEEKNLEASFQQLHSNFNIITDESED
jgi:hypothetical protein